MIINRYDILTFDRQHIVVLAESHEITLGEVVLYNTHRGVYKDIFPEGYWVKVYVNGEEYATREIK